MIEDDKYDVEDLLVHAVEQKPVEFEDTFNSLVLDRIHAAVEQKKQDIARSMYNYVDDAVEDSGEEE